MLSILECDSDLAGKFVCFSVHVHHVVMEECEVTS